MRIALGFLGMVGVAGAAAAGPITGWRGDATGIYPEARPPVTWAKDSNVVWKTKLPARSNASPLILGDRVFACAEPATLVCASLKGGAILWTRPNTYPDVLAPAEIETMNADRSKADAIRAGIKPLRDELKSVGNALKQTPDNADLKAKAAELKTRLGELEGELKQHMAFSEPATHEVNGFASPTPVTDGKAVFVVFGNGVVACYEADGTRRWARLLEKPSNEWGHSASPVVVEGRLIVHIRKVTALDPANGTTLWQTDSAPAWGSEVQARIGDTAVIVTPGGDIIRTADGRKLAAKVSNLTYCAPVVKDGVVYFIQHGGKAVRLPATAGDTVQPEILWTTTPKNDRYYASPVVQDGLIYAVTQAGEFSVIDAADGRIVYTRKLNLGGTAYPSVTSAGGYLFVSSDTGKTVVLEPGREYKEVARNTLEPFRSSPVFAGNRIYVRGMDQLWCLGQ